MKIMETNKLIVKWKSILESLSINKNDYKLFAEYAEQHSLKYTEQHSLNGDFVNDDYSFIMSLKILQQLLENNIKIKISNVSFNNSIQILSVSIGDEFPLSEQYYESVAIQEIIKIIKDKYNNQNIYIYKIIDRIESDQSNRVVKFYSNIKFDTREDKLNRILKNDKL